MKKFLVEARFETTVLFEVEANSEKEAYKKFMENGGIELDWTRDSLIDIDKIEENNSEIRCAFCNRERLFENEGSFLEDGRWVCCWNHRNEVLAGRSLKN